MFGFIWSKVACGVGEYMQPSIKAHIILEQTFPDKKGEILVLVCIK